MKYLSKQHWRGSVNTRQHDPSKTSQGLSAYTSPEKNIPLSWGCSMWKLKAAISKNGINKKK